MIFSKELTLSKGQAITATAPSENVIDFGQAGTVYGASAPINQDVGVGENVPIHVQVVEDFNNLTSLTVSLETSDSEDFTAGKEIFSQKMLLTDLKAGAVCNVRTLPQGTNGRYLRVNYTVAGTAPTSGKMTAGIVAFSGSAS